MKIFDIKHLALLGVLFFSTMQLNAQVTIGVGEEPAKGALLDLKDKNPVSPATVTADENVTATTGGLLLPRVKLEDPASLKPLVADADATATEKIIHAGLTVYNLSTANGFVAGTYVWDGAQWNQVGSGASASGGERWFYMPSFSLELGNINSINNVDLYQEYVKQFNKSQAPAGQFISNNASLEGVFGNLEDELYPENLLDFVVTYYDPATIKDLSIGATNSKLTYTTVNNVNLNHTLAYVTIVVVVRDQPRTIN